MMVSTIHQHDSAIGPPPPELCSHVLPHPTPLGLHRAPGLGSLHHTASSHWLSSLHMLMYLFQYYSLRRLTLSSGFIYIFCGSVTAPLLLDSCLPCDCAILQTLRRMKPQNS